MLTGSWSLGTNTGNISDGGLSGSNVSLDMVNTISSVSVTAAVSSDALTGTLDGHVGWVVFSEQWTFDGAPVTLRRGS